MIETNAFNRLDKNLQQIVASYSQINHRNDQLQLICDNDGTVLSITTSPSLEEAIREQHGAPENPSNFLEQIEEIIVNTRGCVVRTEMKVSRGFRQTLSNFGYNPDQGAITIYPVFYSSSLREIQNVTVNLVPNVADTTNKEPTKPYFHSRIASCLVEPKTGLIIDSNEHFRSLLSIDKEMLARSRFEDIGLNDILLLATLNVDRRCLFPAQLNNSETTRKLVISESETIDGRGCIRMWFPEGIEPKHQTQGLTEETSEALLINWKNKPSKVLICDDNELLLDSCSSILSWAGIPYQVAKNGKEALTHLESDHFDAILLDLNMPLLNGFDTARIIRKSDKPYSNTPIVAMTATPPGRDTFGNQFQNFDALLRKPFDIEDIRIVLEEVLTLNNKQTQKASCRDQHSHKKEQKQNSFQTTSFMRRYRSNTERMENLRTSILKTLSEFETSTYQYHYQCDTEELLIRLQRAQSMSQSIGANALAKQIETVYSQYENTSKTEQETLFLQLVESIHEAEVFYNTVDWLEFIPQKNTQFSHIAA